MTAFNVNERRTLWLIENQYSKQGCPEFEGIDLIVTLPDENEAFWSVYVSHDSCHDHRRHRDDRNTVFAINRETCELRILGRELSMSDVELLFSED